MQTPQRRPLPGVIGRLNDAPYRFQFVQAVRLVLVWLRQNGVPPERALRDLLRFQNGLSLGFPASEIAALAFEARAGLEVAAPMAPQDIARICITPAVIGLLGASGTLPLHYTEQIAAYEHQAQDKSARGWFDMLGQRFVALFAQAWGKYRMEHSLDVFGRDQFRPLVVALGGRAGAWRASRQSPEGRGDDVAAFYLGLLRQHPVSVTALRQVLTGFFGVPIAIEQFVGGWDEIADNRQCKMGGENATLGHSGALGVRNWRHDLRVTLRIGPLDKPEFDDFLPGAPGSVAMAKLLAMVGVAGLQYAVQVVLKPELVGPLVLAGGTAIGRQLGWDTRMGEAMTQDERAGVRYLLRPT